MNVLAAAFPSSLSTGASPPVKALESLLMWSAVSSVPSLVRDRGSRGVGKFSVKEKRGSEYLSPLVGHGSLFDVSADPLPGWQTQP